MQSLQQHLLLPSPGLIGAMIVTFFLAVLYEFLKTIAMIVNYYDQLATAASLTQNDANLLIQGSEKTPLLVGKK